MLLLLSLAYNYIPRVAHEGIGRLQINCHLQYCPLEFFACSFLPLHLVACGMPLQWVVTRTCYYALVSAALVSERLSHFWIFSFSQTILNVTSNLVKVSPELFTWCDNKENAFYTICLPQQSWRHAWQKKRL